MISRSSNLGPIVRRESSVIRFCPRGGLLAHISLFYSTFHLLLHSAALVANSIPVYSSLIFSSHLILCLYFLFFSFIGVCRIVFARQVFRAQAFVIFCIFLRTALLAMRCFCEMFNNLR